MSTPSLSIGIPIYNHGNLLSACLDAILSQSVQPDEILILNDASTDDTQNVIDSYAARIPNLRPLRNETNNGVLGSLNRIVDEATCDWLYLHAADDYLEPGGIQALMSMATTHPDVGIIFGKMRVVTGERDELYVEHVQEWETACHLDPEKFRQYLDIEAPNHSLSASTIYHRDRLKAIGGFPEKLTSWADTFCLRAVGLKYGACYVPEIVNNWTRGDQSYSGQLRKDYSQTMSMIRMASSQMQRPEFRNIFPREHVEDWKSRYLAMVATNATTHMDGLQHEYISIYRHMTSETSGVNRLVRSFMLRLLIYSTKLASAHLRFLFKQKS